MAGFKGMGSFILREIGDYPIFTADAWKSSCATNFVKSTTRQE